MKRLLPLLLLFPVAGFAGKYNDIMDKWIGATQEQVTGQWGYPIKRDHVVRLDDVMVYTYEFGVEEFARFSSYGSLGPCRVSFAFRQKKVIKTRWEGTFCPKIRRPN